MGDICYSIRIKSFGEFLYRSRNLTVDNDQSTAAHEFVDRVFNCIICGVIL